MQDKKIGVVVCLCCKKQQPFHENQILCAFSMKKLHITSFISETYLRGVASRIGVPERLLLGC